MAFLSKIKKTTTHNGGYKSAEEALKAFLGQYNCDYHTSEDKEENYKRYFFDFQGGHFIAFVYEGMKGLEVMFPRILDAPMGELNLVRSMCNRSNTLSLHFKFFYDIDEEKNTVNVNMSFFCNILEGDDLKDTIEQCFKSQRDFVDSYDAAMNAALPAGQSDAEHALARNSREAFLLRQMEFSSQDTKLQFRPNDEEHLTMGQLATELLDLPNVKFTQLQIVGDGLAVINGHEAIAGYDLSTTLIDGEGKEAHFVLDSSVLVLHYVVAQAEGEGEHLITFTLKSEGCDDDTLYYHITLCIEPSDVSRRNSLHSDNDVFPQAITLLVARDLTTTLKKQQEFDYMWKDAAIKINEGKSGELTDEQQFVYDVQDANIGYSMYWGRHYLDQERYYEALLYFKNAYNALRMSFFGMSKDLKTTFFSLCYYIGFCYCDMGLYEKAYYYLDLVGDVGRIDFAMEYINSMANSGDLRIFSAIDDVMADIRDQYDQDDEMPDRIVSLVNFLRRRRAYAFINFGNLDQAEKEFKEMLNDPENRDYAINELAYIQHLRAGDKAAGDVADAHLDSPAGSDAPQGQQ